MEEQQSSSEIDLNLSNNNEDSKFESSEISLDPACDEQILRLLEQKKLVFLVRQQRTASCQSKQSVPQSSNTKNMQSRILGYRRKSKSLESLSSKFVNEFEGKVNNIIELDKITLKLNVQRRRMYDIINTLQSLNVVCKNGKDNYLWKGLHEAVKTIQKYQNNDQPQHLSRDKRQKSLQFLAGGFLRLLIHSKPAISLQEATSVLMKDKTAGQTKTKIRRLYDIINIFKSLGLVAKKHIPNKKTVFQWAGIQTLQQIIVSKNIKKPKIVKIEEKNDLETKNSSFDKSPVFPYATKENISNFDQSLLSQSNFMHHKSSDKHHTEEKTSDNRQKISMQSMLGNLEKFYSGFSAFKLCGPKDK